MRHHVWHRAWRARPVSRANALMMRCLPVLLFVAVLTGCTSPLGRFWPTPAPTPDCGLLLTCPVVLPRCGPVVTSPQETYFWSDNQPDYRLTLPSNVQTLLGFQPLLPASLPTGLSLNRIVVFGPHSSAGHLLLHIAYIDLLRRSNLYPVPVLVLDETIESLGPLDDLNTGVRPPQIQDQFSTVVNGQPAILYHVTTVGTPASGPDAIVAIVLIWHVGAVTLRLIAAPGPNGVEESTVPNPPGTLDKINPWIGLAGDSKTGAKDTALLDLAPRVVPFTGCA